MTVAAKCNITGLALEQVRNLTWGFHCKLDGDALLENYAEYLNCPTLVLPICNNANCDDGITINRCIDFEITKITRIRPEGATDDFSAWFSIEPGDYVGGGTGFVYQWQYDEDIWDIIDGDAVSPILKLKVKDDIFITEDYLTKISVTVTDSTGCMATKACYYSMTGEMVCENVEDVCPIVTNLVVTGV